MLSGFIPIYPHYDTFLASNPFHAFVNCRAVDNNNSLSTMVQSIPFPLPLLLHWSLSRRNLILSLADRLKVASSRPFSHQTRFAFLHPPIHLRRACVCARGVEGETLSPSRMLPSLLHTHVRTVIRACLIVPADARSVASSREDSATVCVCLFFSICFKAG